MRSLKRLLLPAGLCLLLAACSTSAQAPTAISPSTTPTPSSAADEWGLGKPLAVVTGVEGLVNHSSNGVTYVASVGESTKTLAIHHVRWDGTETWSAQVAPPAGVDLSKLHPRMSFDDGLGVVAFWFSESPSDAGLALVSSPITWFKTADGTRGDFTLEPTRSGTLFRNAQTMIGGTEVDPSVENEVAVSVTYLSANLKPETLLSEEIFTGSHHQLSLLQDSGLLFGLDMTGNKIAFTQPDYGLPELAKPAEVIRSQGRGTLFVSALGTYVARLEDGQLRHIYAPTCTLASNERVRSWTSAGGTYIGNLILPTQGKAFCLDQVAQDTEMVPAGVLPDGKVLLFKDPAQATAAPTGTGSAHPSDSHSPTTTPSPTAAAAPASASATATAQSTADSNAPRKHRYALYDPTTNNVTDLGIRTDIGLNQGPAVTTISRNREAKTITIQIYSAEHLDLTAD